MMSRPFDGAIFDRIIFDVPEALSARRRKTYGSSDYGGRQRVQGPIVFTDYTLPESDK